MPMRGERRTRGALSRLAPIAFVAGIVLLGLTVLAFSLAATGAQPQRIEYHEAGVVNGTAWMAYPVPLQGRADLRLDVAFEFPQTGAAYTASCRDLERVKAGGSPLAAGLRSEGKRGTFSTGVPSLAPACPVLYVVLSWPAPDGDLDANRPEVDVVVSSLLAEGPVGAVVAGGGILGAVLAAVGGIGWGRRLQRAGAVEPADADESTAEALLRAAERGGHWLERTRRYLVAAGVLGVFLWYPVLLPWAWRMVLQGTRERWLPWALAGSACALLLALTTVWTLEYLRIERELASWRERVARLRRREAALLGLEGTG